MIFKFCFFFLRIFFYLDLQDLTDTFKYMEMYQDLFDWVCLHLLSIFLTMYYCPLLVQNIQYAWIKWGGSFWLTDLGSSFFAPPALWKNGMGETSKKGNLHNGWQPETREKKKKRESSTRINISGHSPSDSPYLPNPNS